MKSIFCHKAKAAPPAANTLRFEFGNKNYSPVTAGVGGSGTWKRCEFMPGNVWDWTNTSTSWSTAFGGGSTTNPGAFADYENNPVKVIAAGDTSTVTDFSRFFQNCYAITEVCPIDTSGATNVFIMFSHCENCTKFPDMDLSSAIANNGVAGIYQGCYELVSAPNLILPTDHTYSLANFFFNCSKLKNVPLYDTSKCTNMTKMFQGCENLETVPLFNTSECTNMSSMFSASAVSGHLVGTMRIKNIPKFDTSACTIINQMFAGCSLLEQVPEFDTSICTDMHNMFAECHSLKQVPNFDYSKVTRFDDFTFSCTSLTEIPEMNIEANVTRCDSMFENCPNIKSGQKALYDKLSAIVTITNNADCFKDCGSDTEEGRAELAQIPTSWGGTKEEV